jgi:CHASE2 domain-containing sensor protein
MSRIVHLWQLLSRRSRTSLPAKGSATTNRGADQADHTGAGNRPSDVAATDCVDDQDLPANFDHYRFLARLDHGGMGVVYKAQDMRLGRSVALKFLTPEAAADRRALSRFRTEARAASSLNHPAICTVYDVGECKAGTFISMELLEGESLRRLLAHRTLKPAQLIGLAVQIAEGLEAAHSKNVVHRDLKPENLFILPGDRLKILDFGVAKFVSERRPVPPGDSDSTHTDHTQLSQIGAPVGTFAYMSPEQVRSEEVDARSDLFSFGAVLFEMATRRRAFPGKTPIEISAAVLTHTPTLPLDLDPEFRSALQAILDKLLEKTVGYRYQHAADLTADLKRLQRDLTSEGAVADAIHLVAPIGRRLAVDLVRGVAVAALMWSAYSAVAARPSGKYLRQFQLAFIQEHVSQGSLSEADFEVGGRHLPLIVDVSALHPDKSVRTDRKMLDGVVSELLRHRARAIGIDLSFDNLAAADFQYLHRWLNHKNVRVGIYKRAVEERAAWLGRPEFAELAAGIALPRDNPQHAISFSRRWFLRSATNGDSAVDCSGIDDGARCREDLIQLPVALWLLSEGHASVGDVRGRGDERSVQLDKLLTVQSGRFSERTTSGAFEFGTYVIDYSYLKDLRSETIKLTAGPESDLAAQLGTNRARIADRIVLIGDLEDTSDHLCLTGMDPLPGALVHASSLVTLNRGVLFESTQPLSPAVAWGAALLLIATIVALRQAHARSKRLRPLPYDHLELLVFVALALVVVAACRWLATTTGLIVPYFLWISAGLIVYPLAGALSRSGFGLLGIVRGAALTANRARGA